MLEVNFISHMVQMKVGKRNKTKDNVYHFISHMVQMKET